MRAAHVFTLVSLLSLRALGVEPVPPPATELPAPKLVRPAPKKKSAPRFVQRRLQRPSAGEGTPILFSVSETLELLPAINAFEFEPGVKTYSVWPREKTAWLVRDLDHDGQISSGREMFGSFTVLSSGRKAKNGFEALAELDVNHDEVLTAPEYAELQFWFDRNADRRVQKGELEPVDRSLPVTFTIDETCDLHDCGRERAPVKGGWLIDLHLSLRPVRRSVN